MRVALLWGPSIVRDALVNFLESRGRFDVVAASDQPKDCLAAVRTNEAQVILADLGLLDSAQRQFVLGAKVLGSFGLLFVASSSTEGMDSIEGEEIVDVSTSREEFFDRIRRCGEPYQPERSGRRGRRPSNKPFGLSAREYEIAQLIAKGYGNRRISEETGMQEQSVKNAVSTIMRKLNCENRTQVALHILG